MMLALAGASLSTQCSKLSLAVPARDAANTLQASLSGWSVPQVAMDPSPFAGPTQPPQQANPPAAARPCQVEWRASSYCSKAVDAFQWLAFEADLSAANRQTFAPAPGGAVRLSPSLRTTLSPTLHSRPRSRPSPNRPRDRPHPRH